MLSIMSHIGYVFFFWSVWKLLDFALGYICALLIGDKMRAKETEKEKTDQEQRTTVSKLNSAIEVLAKGVASLMVDMNTLKKQKGVTQIVPQDNLPDVTGLEPNTKKRRLHKVGVKKVKEIPLADEPKPKPEHESVKYRRKLKEAKSVESQILEDFVKINAKRKSKDYK